MSTTDGLDVCPLCEAPPGWHFAGCAALVDHPNGPFPNYGGEYAPDCPEKYARCPKGHCRGNPDCPNSVITIERYPGLFEALGCPPDDAAEEVDPWVQDELDRMD